MSNLKKRNSSFELLRIISMFMIVIHHFTYHGTMWSQYSSTNHAFNAAGAYFVLLGKTGVDIFVMLGAYFLVDKRFNFRRPISLILTTLLYSFTIFLIIYSCLPKLLEPTHMTLLKALLPFPIPNGYWFVNSYIFMLICMPFLNKIINSFSKRRIKQLIITLTILWSIVPTLLAILPTKPDFSTDSIGFSGGTFFLLLYLIGAYIKKNGRDIRTSKSLFYLVCIIIFSVFLTSLGVQTRQSFKVLSLVSTIFNPISLIVAIFIFSFFTKFNFHSVLINYISGSMFGVYLIHDNTFLRPYIWKQLVNASKITQANSFISFALVSSIEVFVICLMIDIIFRRILLKWPLKELTQLISNLFTKIFK
ncbi:acyltransferase [Limosilactobacillus coleohominis]|uniref:acyltransferase n=1 Tax=Limosilactobacillus coleohominis TaxID=181675 RepID=UPI0002F6B169|nr:acyltransferase family protein [Limosilactobacillus coleohominis]